MSRTSEIEEYNDEVFLPDMDEEEGKEESKHDWSFRLSKDGEVYYDD